MTSDRGPLWQNLRMANDSSTHLLPLLQEFGQFRDGLSVHFMCDLMVLLQLALVCKVSVLFVQRHNEIKD